MRHAGKAQLLEKINLFLTKSVQDDNDHCV